MSEIWAWFKDPSNQEPLKLLGAAIAFFWTAGFGVYATRNSKHVAKKVEITQGVEPKSKARRATNPFFVWMAGLIAVALGFYGVQRYVSNITEAPTLTAMFKVCRGEFENQCGPHDVFVGCGDPVAWATNACIKFGQTLLSSRGGNHCGYSVTNFSCTQKVPQ